MKRVEYSLQGVSELPSDGGVQADGDNPDAYREETTRHPNKGS